MTDASLPIEYTIEVRDRCLCVRAQRAARTLARRFDEALKPHGLTNGQFSLLMSLNRPETPRIGELAEFLAMDRTTITAALKPLERRGLVTISRDRKDARNRRPALTDSGRQILREALPIWRKTHDAIDKSISPLPPEDLRHALDALV
ncbi:MarR family winged helix-turn-helix transcriptional regulator [Amaricoccus macauensis]|uniref:MarR family winged helix-turn-helix transcriptional regulator n=1 Tax=Amaricoccus macauensis TaxID=57001 RepID=UPI003C7C0B32